MKKYFSMILAAGMFLFGSVSPAAPEGDNLPAMAFEAVLEMSKAVHVPEISADEAAAAIRTATRKIQDVHTLAKENPEKAKQQFAAYQDSEQAEADEDALEEAGGGIPYRFSKDENVRQAYREYMNAMSELNDFVRH